MRSAMTCSSASRFSSFLRLIQLRIVPELFPALEHISAITQTGDAHLPEKIRKAQHHVMVHHVPHFVAKNRCQLIFILRERNHSTMNKNASAHQPERVELRRIDDDKPVVSAAGRKLGQKPVPDLLQDSFPGLQSR